MTDADLELARRLQAQYDAEHARRLGGGGGGERRRGSSVDARAEIVIPTNARPGQPLKFMYKGVQKTVYVPEGARPGETVLFRIPGSATLPSVGGNSNGLRRRDAGHYQGNMSEDEAMRMALEASRRAHERSSRSGGGSRRRPSVQEEKGPLAPPVVKREGYRKSVYMSDQTPCARCEGELKKAGGLTGGKRVFCRLNNSYLNYHSGSRESVIREGRMSKPDGSYNLQRAFNVKLEEGVKLVFSFHGGITKTLTANSLKDAKRWFKCIEERRLWFRDVNSARESRKKMESAMERQQFEIEKQKETVESGGTAGKEDDDEDDEDPDVDEESDDSADETSEKQGEDSPFDAFATSDTTTTTTEKRLPSYSDATFDPFGGDQQDPAKPTTAPDVATTGIARRLSQFDPFADEHDTSPQSVPSSTTDTQGSARRLSQFDPFADDSGTSTPTQGTSNTTSNAPSSADNFDPFADIVTSNVTTNNVTDDPFANIPSAILPGKAVQDASRRSADRINSPGVFSASTTSQSQPTTEPDPFAGLF